MGKPNQGGVLFPRKSSQTPTYLASRKKEEKRTLNREELRRRDSLHWFVV
ncbi:hypothetical protein K435DRAFT_865151 [Dendrothele bispora CBS 962.96]|uniref:Uncharacterized protein n=1 Tax=Dendrothele bispora (strain CBS 962.96) TaxID=1314807 RepID=A0A4S8LK48_DENBC|nr:hypothetical protein K435DRAFT_865151 [Dendrothele bispora CBS 962.96]